MIVSTRRRGFTLIELLIVVVIVGLLASLIAPGMIGKADQARVTAANAQMGYLATAIDAYRLDVGAYPANLGELKASTAANWAGPYWARGEIPKDPWGKDYEFSVPGKDGAPYTLMSYGQGGVEGGDDLESDIFY